jgi:hypothetical protein
VERRGRPREFLHPELQQVLDRMWKIERERPERRQADRNVLSPDLLITLDEVWQATRERGRVPVG